MAQSIAIKESPFTWEGTDSKGKRIKGKTVAVDEAASQFRPPDTPPQKTLD